MKIITEFSQLKVGNSYKINPNHKNYDCYKEDIGEKNTKNEMVLSSILGCWINVILSDGCPSQFLYEDNKFIEVNKFKYLQFLN